MFKHRVSVVIASLAFVFGCTSGPEDDDTKRDAAVYQSVIVDMVQRADMDPVDDQDLPVIFVEAFGLERIALEVQVAVVAALIEEYDVRFVDLRDEAIDDTQPGSPVRSGALLIGLWPIEFEDHAVVRAELYLAADQVSASTYELRGSDSRWAIAPGGRQGVDPEGFLPAS